MKSLPIATVGELKRLHRLFGMTAGIANGMLTAIYDKRGAIVLNVAELFRPQPNSSVITSLSEIKISNVRH